MIIVPNTYIVHPSSQEFAVADLSPFANFDLAIDGSVTHGSNLISQLDDLSGNGHHLVQPSGSLQPLYSDGNDEMLFASDTMYIDIASLNHTNDDDWEIYMVVDFTSFPSLQVVNGFMENVHATYNAEFGLITDDQMSIYKGDGTGGGDRATPAISALSTGTKYITKSSTDADGCYFDVGGETGQVLSTKSDTIDFILIGNRIEDANYYSLKGRIHEIVIMHRALATQEEADLRSFWNTKWSI